MANQLTTITLIHVTGYAKQYLFGTVPQSNAIWVVDQEFPTRCVTRPKMLPKSTTIRVYRQQYDTSSVRLATMSDAQKQLDQYKEKEDSSTRKKVRCDREYRKVEREEEAI